MYSLPPPLTRLPPDPIHPPPPSTPRLGSWEKLVAATEDLHFRLKADPLMRPVLFGSGGGSGPARQYVVRGAYCA